MFVVWQKLHSWYAMAVCVRKRRLLNLPWSSVTQWAHGESCQNALRYFVWSPGFVFFSILITQSNQTMCVCSESAFEGVSNRIRNRFSVNSTKNAETSILSAANKRTEFQAPTQFRVNSVSLAQIDIDSMKCYNCHREWKHNSVPSGNRL